MFELLVEFLWSKTLSAPSFGRYWKQPIGSPYSIYRKFVCFNFYVISFFFNDTKCLQVCFKKVQTSASGQYSSYLEFIKCHTMIIMFDIPSRMILYPEDKSTSSYILDDKQQELFFTSQRKLKLWHSYYSFEL